MVGALSPPPHLSPSISFHSPAQIGTVIALAAGIYVIVVGPSAAAGLKKLGSKVCNDLHPAISKTMVGPPHDRTLTVAFLHSVQSSSSSRAKESVPAANTADWLQVRRRSCLGVMQSHSSHRQLQRWISRCCLMNLLD